MKNYSKNSKESVTLHSMPMILEKSLKKNLEKIFQLLKDSFIFSS